MESQLEVFIDDEGGVDSVAIVLRGASIVEYEGELVPGCTLTPHLARTLANALWQKAKEIDPA